MNIASKLYPSSAGPVYRTLSSVCLQMWQQRRQIISRHNVHYKINYVFFLQVSVWRLRNYCCEHSRFSACSTFDSNFPHTAYTIYLPTGKSWLSQYVIYRSSMPMGYHNSFCVHELHTERLMYAVTYKYAHGFVEPNYFWLWKLTVYRSF